ncbi:membrane protein [Pontibacillus chungwhensis BH030062]|uniref:Membrane protein n=1 Tax=Pontibacillus chungwhensis BH030062 TaxID=1385513 RepID=A0A0A2UW68_9BACI|nr:VC0807 family protein [Pontibacillus chungwhensis]KGP90741.1 membrane protein [Pontibacillus chungwhensis BH030062]
MNQKNIVVWDLICYIVFPLVVWNFIRDDIGDYYAMLLSSVPGIIYTFIRFKAVKKVQFFGIFMLANLVVGTLFDVLAGSAIQLLWNRVYFALLGGGIFLGSMLIRKPIALYLMLDVMEMQGQDRKGLKAKFMQKKVFFVFQLITFVFVFRELVFAGWKAWLVTQYGVEAFDQALVLRQVMSWVLTGVTVIGYVYVFKLLQMTPPTNENTKYST